MGDSLVNFSFENKTSKLISSLPDPYRILKLFLNIPIFMTTYIFSCQQQERIRTTLPIIWLEYPLWAWFTKSDMAHLKVGITESKFTKPFWKILPDSCSQFQVYKWETATAKIATKPWDILVSLSKEEFLNYVRISEGRASSIIGVHMCVWTSVNS